MIVGIDEVGRGAWAGPLTVGAVLLGGQTIEGLTDSKKLTKKQREYLDKEIRQKALAIGLGWVRAKQIDEIGLSAALKLASRRALAHIFYDYTEIIIDGTVAFIDHPKVTLMKKADLLVPSVSAASIVAKVARDNYMKHLDTVFPGYKFAAHVGYGTAHHRNALDICGISPVHRMSFQPIELYAGMVVPHKKLPIKNSYITTKSIGNTAEEMAAKYLEARGHTILARNWRTKYCEIDIISVYKETIYFTEVKYRKNENYGGGLAAITVKKQNQMAFAAKLYVVKNKHKNSSMRLAAVEVSGMNFDVTSFLELG